MEKKLRFVWWGILGALLVAAGWKWFLPHQSPVSVSDSPGREIVVYITGAVANPGLFELASSARLDDAVKQAELLPEANIEVLNLAEKLKDGQKITIPYKQELPTNPGTLGSSPVTDGQIPESLAQTPSPIDSLGRININLAGVSELDKLPGIGPALAQRIIDYRNQNGYFTSPEGLKQVSGIGDKIYERLSSQIMVGP